MQRRKKLIFWRVTNGMKQVDVSRRLGISNTYYSNLERGRVNPSFKLLVRFKDTFEVGDVIELFRLS